MYGELIKGTLVCVWTTQGAADATCAPDGIHPACLVRQIWESHFQNVLPKGTAVRAKSIGLPTLH
jgi:hypothetical protein